MQEHFLSAEGLQLLQLNENVNVFGIPSRSSGRGRPSGGVAIIVRASLRASTFKEADFYIAVKIKNTVVLSVYIPTNYRNVQSDNKFNIACGKVAAVATLCAAEKISCIIAGDMNSNLSDANDPRGQILLDACPSLRVLRN